MTNQFKLYITCLITILFVFVKPITTFAQDSQPSASVNLETTDQPAEIESSKELRAEFKQYTQNPSSKKVKFEMILYPTISTERLLIEWTVRGVSLPTEESKLNGYLKVQAGQTYKLSIEVIPTTQGTSEVYGRAQIFEAQSNIVSTVRKNFASNIKGEILPISEDYKQLKTSQTISRFVVGGGIVVTIIILGFIGLKKFVRWLDKDDRV